MRGRTSTPYEVWVVEVPQYPQLTQDALRLGHLREDLRYLLDRHFLVRLAGSARRPHLAVCGTHSRVKRPRAANMRGGGAGTCAATDVVEQLVALQGVGPHSSEELGVRGVGGASDRLRRSRHGEGPARARSLGAAPPPCAAVAAVRGLLYRAASRCAQRSQSSPLTSTCGAWRKVESQPLQS